MDMKILQVLDRLIPYDAFLNDLAARIVGMIKGKIESYKRPGKVEYRTSDLRILQRTVQDYMEPPLKEKIGNNRKRKKI